MVDFNKLIDNHLAKEFFPKKIGRYYPSEISSCLRKTWYSYKIPRQVNTELTRLFETGNMLHSFIEDVIKSEKNPDVELLQSEVPIKIKEKEFLISGRIDDLILVKIEDKIVLLEVKSCKYLPKELRKEHESQLQLYMHATSVHDGILLYLQKDNLKAIWFDVSYNKEKVKKLLERFNSLHKFLAEDKIPEAEAKHNQDMDWLCDKCLWKEECFSRED